MDTFRSALSLVIHKKGRVHKSDVDSLLSRYLGRGVHVDPSEYIQAIRTATKHYWGNTTCLFICTDGPCQKQAVIENSKESLEKLSEELGCPVELTGCHWQCDHASVITLKNDSKCTSFLNCSSYPGWEFVRESVKLLVQSASSSFSHNCSRQTEEAQ